ncbi:MAG: peptidase S41 [Cyanobacteria bacterium QH_8_48_120]|nr:MAG: peptidase S41 [Cyanobacteria bacterium QH_6_48_35]PSO73331.1 MAG: peptidase S41 [Cyanobacteria bacterium QH_8_48_120]
MVVTKNRLVFSATAAVVTTVAVTSAGVHLSQSQTVFRESPKEVVDEVWQIVNREYVDSTFNQVNWRAVRQEYLSRSYSDKQAAYKAIDQMLKKLDDPYTRFLEPKEFKSLQIDTSGELTGVGIKLAQDEETDKLTVVAPIQGTPASKAGIVAEDVITAIDGQSTQGMELSKAVSLIRGKPGSQVTLTIQRGNQEKEYQITRQKIEIHPVRARSVNTELGEVGYIRLSQFSAQAPEEMQNAIKRLKKQDVQGYVLDLRSNPGGLLSASIEIARMWMDEGTIVSVEDRQGELERRESQNPALTEKPLVVLVDGGSASASEILAGALKDQNRATLVGSQTFGKGLVQSVRGIGDGSGLAVTIAKYRTPDGKYINHKGISPDIVSKLSEQQRKELQSNRTEIGTSDDPQFAKALNVLTNEIASQKGSLQETANQ